MDPNVSKRKRMVRWGGSLTSQWEKKPKITVGILDRQAEISGHLNGMFRGESFGPVSGFFSAHAASGTIVLLDEAGRPIARSPLIKLKAGQGSHFSLFNVTIGNRFHWERRKDLSFQGDLILLLCDDGAMAVINEIPLEDYLASVISSEMNPSAPFEFLKAHAILSRSWLLAALHRKEGVNRSGIDVPLGAKKTPGASAHAPGDEVVRWYDREDHPCFDVCGDDHCQRYQGISGIVCRHAGEAVRETHGTVITHLNEICDARYSKACGGLTEHFDTAWDDRQVPYLVSVPDTPAPHPPIRSEEEASAWILSSPDAYCGSSDEAILEKILPDADRETKFFFRWKVEYSRKELEEIIREKTGLDFGILKAILPLRRGPSGRISRLRITGSKRTMIVGKELEIRRWLSRSHLYSSAFLVTAEAGRFTFHGAGWGHGVGLCQIGAAVMASRGRSAEEILKHYFTGVEIRKIY